MPSAEPAAARPGAGARRPPFALGVALAAAAATLTHLGSLRAPFFADDWLFLDQVRFHTLGRVLASPDPLGNFFRPLGRQVWFWLLANLSGESPVAFHAANLLCLVAAVVLLALLARRLAGPFAGVIAGAFLAVHYAADVPVLWASGSQELLSLVLALGALLLYTGGRRGWAALALFLALLSKEAVVLAPVAAVALDRAPGGWRARGRRALPLALAVLAWALLAAWAMARRGAPGAGMSLTPLGPLAAPLLLARVALGLEWQTGALPLTRLTGVGAASVLGLLLAATAVACAAPRAAAKPAARPGRAARRREARRAGPGAPAAGSGERARELGAVARAGLVWALAGALPVAAVAPLWSSYYFLFALAGVGLALGAWAERLRVPATVAALALLAAGFASSQARGLQEFATAPSAWSGQSHVNRFYLERGMRVISRCIADLRAQLPRPEPRTTLFFTGLPSFASFQVADGPLVRGVYRDTTLLGFYLSQFTRARLERGPWRVFFYDQHTGRLMDRTREHGIFLSTALGMILEARFDVAEAALEAAHENGEDDMGRPYVSALVAVALGRHDEARAAFAEARYGSGGDGPGAVRRARAQAAAKDTLGAILTLQQGIREDVFDPSVHAYAADVMLATREHVPEGELEAFAARVLEPDSPTAWRRWAGVLAYESRQPEALAALDRYVQLAPEVAARDEAAIRLRVLLKRMLPGGDIAQRSMQRELTR